LVGIETGGLPAVGCHGLRHFYASALIRAGLSVKVVSTRLGHSNAALTLNTYSHLWPDDEDRTRTAIDDIFRSDVPRMRPVEGS
jgi:integrase